MTDEWMPRSVRQGKAGTYEALHEGIPPWLASSLWSWVDARLWDRAGNLRERRLLEIERCCRIQLDWRNQGYSAKESLAYLMRGQPEEFLDAVDLLLHLESSRYTPGELEQVLAQAGSAWRVVERDETFRLERRVGATVAETADRVMGSSGRAGHLLSRAWAATYGRSPNSSAAYREAVRAVEAAAQPVILPTDTQATLGKMVAAFRDGKGKWEFALRPTGADAHDVVLNMMQLLWFGQHDRHGTGDPARPVQVTDEEAAAAVHLAVTLVHWFLTGAVRRA